MNKVTKWMKEHEDKIISIGSVVVGVGALAGTAYIFHKLSKYDAEPELNMNNVSVDLAEAWDWAVDELGIKVDISCDGYNMVNPNCERGAIWIVGGDATHYSGLFDTIADLYRAHQQGLPLKADEEFLSKFDIIDVTGWSAGSESLVF